MSWEGTSNEFLDHEFKMGSVGRTLYEGIQALSKDGLLFDYTVRVEDKEYQVHKIVMAIFSEFFKVMLTSQFQQSEENYIDLKGVTNSGFEPIIKYIYTSSRLAISHDNVVDILSCSTQLQIDIITELCIEHLSECIAAENCIQTLNLVLFYGLESKSVDLKEEALNSLVNNFDTLVVEPEFNELSADAFKCVLSSRNICKSETYRLNLITDWLKADESRAAEVPSLVEEIRFSLVRTEDLKKLPQQFQFLEDDPKCRMIFEEALKWHELPIRKRVLTEQYRTCIRDAPVIVTFGGEIYQGNEVDQSPNTAMFALKENNWEKVHGFVPPKSPVMRGCAVGVVNNFLILCGGYKNSRNHVASSACNIFDPRTMTWGTMCSLNVARAHSAIAVHNNKVYVFGGENRGFFTNIVERYDFEEDRWERVSKFEKGISKTAACTFDNYIYLIGGQTKLGKHVSNSKAVNVFDPVSNEWFSRPGLSAAVNGHAAFEMYDRRPDVFSRERCIYVVQRMSGHISSYYPSCCQWRKISLHAMPPSEASTVRHIKKVYYINGRTSKVNCSDGDKHKYHVCAVYDPNALGREKLSFIRQYPLAANGLIACELAINWQLNDPEEIHVRHCET